MDLELRSRVAIVTGGSMSVGKACVEALAGQGVRVATCARGIDRLKEVVEEISSKTETEILAVQADVTKSEDVKHFIAAAYQKFGRIDILVNSAVNFVSGDFSELTDENWWNHFDTKVIGCVRCAREALPYMKDRKWGRILNMAGSAARSGGGTSGATNAAIINFTKVLSDEVAKDGITVNAIHPTTTSATGGKLLRLEDSARRGGISIEEARVEAMRRLQEYSGPQAGAEDAADMVLFLSSDKAAAITGQTIAARGNFKGVYY